LQAHFVYTNFTPNDCKNTKNYEDLCQDTVKRNMAQTEIKESGEISTNPDKTRVYKEL